MHLLRDSPLVAHEGEIRKRHGTHHHDYGSGIGEVMLIGEVILEFDFAARLRQSRLVRRKVVLNPVDRTE